MGLRRNAASPHWRIPLDAIYSNAQDAAKSRGLSLLEARVMSSTPSLHPSKSPAPVHRNTTKLPALVTQCRQPKDLDAVSREKLRKVCPHNDGMRTGCRPYDSGAWRRRSRQTFLTSERSHRATCRRGGSRTTAHDVAATTRVGSFDPSASSDQHVREHSADVRREQL
ncbi:hypothetical protein OPT61_g4692 [Boeremia exigua]|uniref:Uncharacterized protein n=1 Tax=Boeremia exigua TaxID=749465 RepID=A0ACC2ID60_9PLEO|nr:hypothetical protein OPT61_g4692 [Boeremia exigua]